MKHLRIWTVIISAMMLLTACSVQPEQQAGGGDDFPNIIADAGKAINDNMNQSWEHPSVPEDDPVKALDNANLPVEALDAPITKLLAKEKSGACDELTVSFNEDENTITVTHKQCKNTFTQYDTLVLFVDGADTLIKKISGAKEFSSGLIQREAYVISDRDGDSVLVNNITDIQQVNVFLGQQLTDKLFKQFMYAIDPGESNDFSVEHDNRIIAMTTLVTHENDTISSTVLTDADEDGFVAVIMDDDDSAVVDVEMVDRLLEDTPLAFETTLKIRMMVFKDESRNYCIRYNSKKRFSGYDVNWSMENVSGDSDFYAGDTIVAKRIIIPVDNDSIQGDTLSVTVLTGQNPTDSTDDALLAIDVHKKLKKGEGREIVFTFTADKPVYPETTDWTGSVFYRTRLANDFEIEVNGIIGEDEITAEAVTSEGDIWSVTWDRDGKVLSYSHTE